MNINTINIRWQFLYMECLIGFIGLTPLTHTFSFHILEMNAKSVNVGRTLSLLNLQKARGLSPQIFHILLVAAMDNDSLRV